MHIRGHVLGPLLKRELEEPCAHVDHAAYNITWNAMVYQLHEPT